MPLALSTMQLTSPAFASSGMLPAKYTGEGDDVSPPLEWVDAPEGTRSFAVFCHDPDAPVVENGGYGFSHWVAYNIPASARGLTEGSSEYTNGTSGFGTLRYGGLLPPPGHGPHHYFFWLLALSGAPDLPEGLTLRQLLERTESQTLGMNRLVGVYERR